MPQISKSDRTPDLEGLAGLSLLDAVLLALDHDPNIALAESRYESARGLLLISRSQFDLNLESTLERDQSRSPTTESTSQDATQITSTVRLTAPLRNGLTLAPNLSLTRDEGSPTVNTATVSFTVRQPLLRDRGRDVTTANERASELEWQARGYDLRHEISRRIQSVISSYWAYRAAAMNLEIQLATEDSSRELLRTTKRLIDADLTPAAELKQLEADLTFRESNRIASERSLFEARQNLGREIGLPAEKILKLSHPRDTFPDIAADRVPIEAMERWIAESLDERGDVRAARERLTASEILLQAADNALEPQLDLTLTPSYTGLVEGESAGDFLSPIYSNVPGFSTLVGLSFSWPISNQRARGEQIQSQESLRQSELSLEQLEKDVGVEIPLRLDAVYRNALQVERIAEAVRLFEETVENERKKLRAGSSTLIDVINQLDRLTSAQQQEISARLALAQALADLRFQSGTLVESDGRLHTIDRERLITLPSSEFEP